MLLTEVLTIIVAFSRLLRPDLFLVLEKGALFLLSQ